jgi:hypothetical protein
VNHLFLIGMSYQDFQSMDWFGKHDWDLVLKLIADVLSVVCTKNELYKFLPQSSHLIRNCPVSIVEPIVTECSTETTLSHHSGGSVVLSTSAAMSTALTGVSAATCTSSSSSHGEEREYEECALPTLRSVFS